MEEEAVLKELGFESREAKIYLTLLKLSTATASKIADEVGIDRTTTYDILNRLIEKGIVSYVIKNNVKYFKAAAPEQLMSDLKEKEKLLANIMPKLEVLTQIEKEETSVELFKGKEGIITVLKIMLRDKQDYIFIGGAQDFCRTIPIFMQQFLRRAYEAGMKGKLICEEGFGDNPEDVIGKLETFRVASKTLLSSTIKVWGNKTAFFIFTEPYHAILIQSKEIAERQRLFFDNLWKQAKEPSNSLKEKTLMK